MGGHVFSLGWPQELESQLGTMRTELAEAEELRSEVEALGDEELVQEADQTVAGLQVRGRPAPDHAYRAASVTPSPFICKQATSGCCAI